MTTLSDNQIIARLQKDLVIKPLNENQFNRNHIQPGSIDLTLWTKLEVIKKSGLIDIENVSKKNIDDYIEKLNTDSYTLEDVVQSLKKPNRDPRDEMPQPILKSDVLTIDDLKIGMKLEGTVRNVVDFGAFIDIGLHNDGLVHISKITNKYIKHPSEVLSVGDIVTCYVIDINKEKEKVSLSLINPIEK